MCKTSFFYCIIRYLLKALTIKNILIDISRTKIVIYINLSNYFITTIAELFGERCNELTIHYILYAIGY